MHGNSVGGPEGRREEDERGGGGGEWGADARGKKHDVGTKNEVRCKKKGKREE